ncbi:MAG: type I-E CRISPR-associated protein Cas5/CasD [Candidatus Hinthialibacter antarcticus]|nr:type I-E CRISPR-associated protein Cas5/CasD [Candidatus Hinthialibacter antarcticus]
MSCLLLRLAAPMQSWGTQSRFTERDAGREPSKSGVVGLLCAALGVDRADEDGIRPLAELKMAVRIDHDGIISRDYQTAGGGDIPGVKKYGVLKSEGKVGETVVSNRYYLADAEFHVALEGPDELLRQIHHALLNPHWPLYLGRKAFPPEAPLSLGVKEGDCPSVLQAVPWRQRSLKTPKDKLRMVIECEPDEGVARMDLPVSFIKHDRCFRLRYVKSQLIDGFPIDDGKEERNVSLASHAKS